MEKSDRKTLEKFCFFAKKQVFLSRKYQRGIMSKKRKKGLMETICFLYTQRKSYWQNLQFFGKSVDKISKIDYIVKNKTNRCGKY